MREFCFGCYKITNVKVKKTRIIINNKKLKVFVVYCKECYKEVYNDKYEIKNNKILRKLKEKQQMKVFETYVIVRYYQDTNKGPQIIRRGLTLDEAQAHCSSDDTKGDGWFDGYQKEE